MTFSSSTGPRKKVPFVEFWKGIGIWGYISLFFLMGIQLYLFVFLPVGYACREKPNNLQINPPHRQFQLFYVLGSETKVIDEQALLWDSSPLYLPTKYNYAQTITRFKKHFYGNELLMMYAPNLGMLEQFKQHMPSGICCNYLDINYILALVGEDVFKPIGQVPLTVSPLKPRLARVCIRNFAMQELVYCKDITDMEGAPGELSLWEYAAFTLDVSNMGKNMPALMLHSSGQEALDQAFRHYIQHSFEVLGLPDGYYEVDFTP